MTRHHLAQVNIGRLLAPLDALESAGFADNLARINALAEAAPGFVWRLTGDGDDATDIVAFDDPTILINMSVWESPEALAGFVYRSAHRDFVRGRHAWLHPMETALALWWVPAGHRPTPGEARARLETLRRLGPGPDAFTFKSLFQAPDAVASPLPNSDECA